MSALSTTRRVLGGAAISAVLLGAGSGMAFADISADNTGNPTFGDQSNNTVAGNGGAGAGSGDATGGAGTDGDGGGAESGAGGPGGAGGSIGANSPTQNATNQQQFVDVTQNATSTGGLGADGAEDGNGGDGGAGGDIAQSVDSSFGGSSLAQGAGSTATVLAPAVAAPLSGPGGMGGSSSATNEIGGAGGGSGSSAGGAGSGTSAGTIGNVSFGTPLGSSPIGEEVALGAAIAALFGASGVTMARRRHSSGGVHRAV